VPVTLGQEFSGYASQVAHGIERITATIPRLAQVPLGGTATGSGLNVHPEFAERVRQRLAADSGLAVRAPDDPFEATGARDALVELSGALKTVAVSLMKIANDVRLLGSGPRTGIGELRLPELQKGSSMMPGKVNPVIPEVVAQVAAQVVGNDAAVTMAGTHGHLELNAFVPVMARNVLESIALLVAAARVFAERCVDGLEPDLDACRRSAELSLSAATVLNPILGYERVATLVGQAAVTGRPLRDVAVEQGIEPELLDAVLEPLALARGGILADGPDG
jgi:fumarate hydratase class II